MSSKDLRLTRNSYARHFLGVYTCLFAATLVLYARRGARFNVVVLTICCLYLLDTGKVGKLGRRPGMRKCCDTDASRFWQPASSSTPTSLSSIVPPAHWITGRTIRTAASISIMSRSPSLPYLLPNFHAAIDSFSWLLSVRLPIFAVTPHEA